MTDGAGPSVCKSETLLTAGSKENKDQPQKQKTTSGNMTRKPKHVKAEICKFVRNHLD